MDFTRMRSRCGLFFLTLSLSSFWLSLPRAHGAEFKPAPQEFRQEVSVRIAPPPGVATNGFILTDIAPDGAVRVTDGSGWYVVREARLEVISPPQDAAEWPNYLYLGTTARKSPVPLSAIRQIHRQGDVVA